MQKLQKFDVKNGMYQTFVISCQILVKKLNRFDIKLTTKLMKQTFS